MADSRDLLQRISALRQRLDQAQSLLGEPGAAAATALADSSSLEQKVAQGRWHSHLIDAALRPLTDANVPLALPPRLTIRAMRLLEKGRELVHDLRTLADQPLLKNDDQGPLARLHAQAVAMLEAALRTIQAFPPSPSAQMRLCEGLEAVVLDVAQRRAALHQAYAQRQREHERVERLAEMLSKLAGGYAARLRDLHGLADEIHQEAESRQPLRFLKAPGSDPDPLRSLAAHGLNVAQVMARVLAAEAILPGQEQDALAVALVHDVGMVRMPGELLSEPGPLTDDQRRQLERHPALGAQLATKLWTGGGWPLEAIHDHHERVDGTGYPAGKRDMALSAATRLLAVCDVYAAMCCPRPYRHALDTRAALTDTLLLADQGALDRFQAEKLMHLSFYPIGSVVELADGAVGIVVATHPGERGLQHPAKPILNLLCDAQGEALAAPRLLDLTAEDQRTIIRSLPEHERFKVVGRHYPGLV